MSHIYSRAVGLCLGLALVFSGLTPAVQALTYNELVQSQTGGRVLGTATPALVAHGSTGALSQGGTATTAALNTTGANLLVAVVSSFGQSAASASVVDSKGNSWTAIQNYTSGICNVALWYAKNATVGSSHTFSVTGAYSSIAVYAFSGVDASNPLDVQNGNSVATGNSVFTNNITATADGVMVSGLCYSGTPSGAPVIDSGFSNPPDEYLPLVGGQHVGVAASYQIVTNGAGKNATWSNLNMDSTGLAAAIAWVQVPNLSPTSDTVIYMYYGNSSASLVDQQQASNVWDSNYKNVWHMSQTPTGSANDLLDSTSNGNHLTSSGMSNADQSSGKIDGAITYSASKSASRSAGTYTAVGGDLTVSVWVNDITNTSQHRPIIHYGATASVPGNWELGVLTNTIEFTNWPNGGSTQTATTTIGTNIMTGSAGFHYLTVTRNSTTGVITAYLNGVRTGTVTGQTGTMDGAQNTRAINVGANALGASGWLGQLDELKVSNTVRSADWIKTEYNNQSSPSTFYSTQSQQTVRAGRTANTGLKAPNTGWYNTAWPYRVQITIDRTKVGTASSTTLTDFPFLASTTSASLKSIANGGNVASSTGADILFTSSDGVTKLAYEIESYASTTGQLLAWVEIPTLSPTTDTVLYMYYGNQTSGLADQQNRTAVWDDNYKGVWHLGESSGTVAGDSTVNPSNGTLVSGPSWTTGVTGPALDFTSAGYVTIPNASKLQISDYITAECWLYITSTSDMKCMGKTVTDFSYELGVNRSSQYFSPVVKVGGGQYSNQLAWPGGIGGLNPYLNSWVHLAVTYDGANIKTYVNGIARVTYPASGSINVTNNALGIGARGGDGSARFNSRVDEVRVSSVARSADWIVTQYNNQSNPGTFAAWSSQQSISGGVSAWKDTGWTSRKTLIINHEKVSGTSALANFPVLVNLTDSDWATVANGGHMGQSDGKDIYFTASDGVTTLAYEREKYTPTTGELVAWVKIPSLSPTQDTIIYMYYGNSSASLADQQNATAVWDSNYKGVWHLGEASGATAVADSTANASNGTKAGTAPTQSAGAIIGNAMNFGGAGYVDMGILTFWILRETIRSRRGFVFLDIKAPVLTGLFWVKGIFLITRGMACI